MPGAAFVFGFDCALEDTLMAKDSGAFSSVNTQSENKGVLCWCDLDQDHTVHGASKELMNQCLEWIYQFLWCIMIWVILDHRPKSMIYTL